MMNKTDIVRTLSADERGALQERLDAGLWEDALEALIQQIAFPELASWVLQRFTREMSDSTPQGECLRVMRAWLSDRHEDALRYSIFEQASELGFDTPTGALGLSMFWSQGSMTPAELEPVYPEPHLAALMLHCSLKLLCVAEDPDMTPQEGATRLLQPWLIGGAY